MDKGQPSYLFFGPSSSVDGLLGRGVDRTDRRRRRRLVRVRFPPVVAGLGVGRQVVHRRNTCRRPTTHSVKVLPNSISSRRGPFVRHRVCHLRLPLLSSWFLFFGARISCVTSPTTRLETKTTTLRGLLPLQVDTFGDKSIKI